jgi:CO dehydrogenase/acetyl-CoA synthase epsilon subunit
MHWILNVDSGKEFISSSKHFIWGVNESAPFLAEVTENDLLWFVQTGGQLIAVATYTKQVKRELGPLIATTLTNEELGWKTDEPYDTEIHYKDLYNVTTLELQIGKIQKYSKKCKINLLAEYLNILKYSTVTKTMDLPRVAPAADYDKMKVVELKELCKDRKIKGISGKNKADLILMLELKDAMPSAPVTGPAYKKMKVAELKQLCKDRKIKGITGKKKIELISMLEAGPAAPAVSPTLSIE